MGRVLIVDDEETYRTQLSLIVTSKGHEVQSTVDGQEAISIGSVFLPDLLVTDWRLKHDMTGLQVAEALRKAKPRLQIIVITGYSAEDVTDETDADFIKILEKPFTLDDFSAAVDQAMAASGQGP